MVRPSRRSILASLVTVPVAGCLGAFGDDSSRGKANTPTTEPEDASPSLDDGNSSTTSTVEANTSHAIGTPVEIGTETITVANPRVETVVVLDRGLWGDVDVADGQYLVVRVTGSEGTSLADDYDEVRNLPLAVALDDELHRPQPRMVATVPPGREPTDPESLAHHAVGLSLPTTKTDAAAVVWEGESGSTSWRLGPGVRDRLARSPAFDVRSLDLQVLGDGSIEVAMTVANDGDRAGRWLAQVSVQSVDDESNVFGFDVPRGTTVTRSVRPPILAGDFLRSISAEAVTVQFRSTTTLARTVSIGSGTGTADGK